MIDTGSPTRFEIRVAKLAPKLKLDLRGGNRAISLDDGYDLEAAGVTRRPEMGSTVTLLV
jgi:hypothetical protein